MTDTTERKPAQWTKVVGLIVVWGATVYLIMNDTLLYDGPGDLFALMLYLVGALVLSLAIWWGFSLDVRFQIGSTDSGSMVAHTTFGRGFAFGATIIALLALAVYIPTAHVAKESKRRSMSAYESMTQVLRAKQDLSVGHRLRPVDLGYMAIHRNYVNAQYIDIHDRDAIVGAVVTMDIKAGSPVLRTFLKTPEAESQQEN